MDPNANLSEQLTLAKAILHGKGDEHDAVRLAELVQSLNDWIRQGGAYPALWKRKTDQGGTWPAVR